MAHPHQRTGERSRRCLLGVERIHGRLRPAQNRQARCMRQGAGDLGPILEEVLGQKWDYLVPYDVIDIGRCVAADEIGMPEPMVSIGQIV